MLSRIVQMFPGLGRFEMGVAERDAAVTQAMAAATEARMALRRAAELSRGFDPKGARELEKIADTVERRRKRWWSF